MDNAFIRMVIKSTAETAQPRVHGLKKHVVIKKKKNHSFLEIVVRRECYKSPQW